MAEEKITLVVKLKAKEGMGEALRQECLSLVEPTRGEAGCISYDFHESTGDDLLFAFYENWTNQKALDKHVQTPYLQAFFAKTDELLAEPMNVTIWRKLS